MDNQKKDKKNEITLLKKINSELNFIEEKLDSWIELESFDEDLKNI